MIAGNEADIIRTVETLMKARSHLATVEALSNSRFDIAGFDNNTVYITRGELVNVLKARVAEFEAKAHELGVYGPGAAQTAKGLALASLHDIPTNSKARGLTS